MPYNPYPSYNAYSIYPTGNLQQPVQSYAQNQPAQYPQQTGICWVDGEVGAKAQQIPPGWDITKPFPMWDTNDQIIYLKSFNQMGMPNPLTKLHYTIEEPSRQAPMMSNTAALPSGEQNAPDMSQYVRRDELKQMTDELKAVLTRQEKKEEDGHGKPSV